MCHAKNDNNVSDSVKTFIEHYWETVVGLSKNDVQICLQRHQAAKTTSGLFEKRYKS